MKPLGQKSYGSIPHLSNSKLGPGDYHCHEGQERIATVKARDKHDIVIVQEKLDGGNVGICKVNGKIHAITRAGYLATTSQYETHFVFDKWVKDNYKRFNALLKEGERACGEWLYHAVGTRYKLPHEPFVAFDLILGNKRESLFTASKRLCEHGFTMPYTIHVGDAISVDNALDILGIYGKHGALEPVEGLVYRVERKGQVDFLCKYVRNDKQNGIYFPEISGGELIINEHSYNNG
jgi:ATP-dependent RNA circularization protein (DNA/RNA ligase family)